MNIAKIIAKFMKEGIASLNAEEKALLSANVGLLSPNQKSAYEKAIGDEDGEGEDGDGEGDDDGEGEGAGAGEGDGEGEGEGVDEKALRQLISKGINSEMAGRVDKIANQLVAKFFAGVNAQRKTAINANDKKKDTNEVRDFFKALVTGDREALKSFKAKTATANEAGDNAKGGYLVPEELRAEVLRIAEAQYGLARRDFMYLPFTGAGDTRKIPTLATSVSVSWVNEKGNKPGTNPTFGLVTQTLKKLAAIIPFTEELLEDSAVNITQLLATLFAEAVAKEEDLQFFMGTGSPWTGILNNANVKKVDLATGIGVSGISFEKLVDMQDEIPSGALPGAKYYMNRTIFSYLRKLRADAVSGGDGKGQFLLPPTKQAIEDILGYPIELTDALPSKTLTGNQKPFVAFGNMKLAAIFGDKQQIRVKLLDQATITDGDGTTVINLAEQDMLAIRAEERVGYVAALPGAVCVLRTGAAS